MRLSILGIALFSFSMSARAEKSVALPMLLCQPGALVYEDSFEEERLSAQWAVERGTWAVRDGSLVGRELATDDNSASITFDKTNRDSIIRFSFRFDGAQSFNLAFNRDKNVSHLARIYITDGGLKVRIARNSRDSESRPVTLGHVDGSFRKSQWYTLQVELLGDQIAAQTDNGLKIIGRHAALKTTKPNYQFKVHGQGFCLDDLKIFEVARPSAPSSPRRVVFLIGERESDSQAFLPEFAANELKPLGINSSFVVARSNDPTGAERHHFDGFESEMRNADVLFLSIRRRALNKSLMEFVRGWCDAGKPVVAIRTSSHGFAPTPKDQDTVPAGHLTWATFDRDVLGVTYEGAYDNRAKNGGPPTDVLLAKGARLHPVFKKVTPSQGWQSSAHLYRHRNCLGT